MRVLMLAIVLASSAAAAAADERPWAKGVPAAVQKTATELFEDGNKVFDEQRYAEALSKYREALAQWDHPAVRFNAGICLVHLGQPVEAHEFFQAALRFDGRPLSEGKPEQARAYLRLLDGQLGTLEVSTKQTGTVITLDGKRLLTGPGTVQRRLVAGPHQLVASKKGMLTRTETLDVRAGMALKREIRLVAMTSANVEVRRRWNKWMPWIVMGSGVALAGAAVPFEILARKNFDRFDDAVLDICPDGCFESTLPPSSRDARDRGRIQRGFSLSGFALGGAAIATGAVMAILNRPQIVERDTLSVWATPEGTGITVSLEF